jgi:hypothetical protein
LGPTQIKLHGFQLADLLRYEAELLFMLEKMLHVLATVFVLFALIVAFMHLTHVATHHSSMVCIRSNSLDISTEQYH